MKKLKIIIFFFVLLIILGANILFQKLIIYTPAAQSAEVEVILLLPINNSYLSGNILVKAQTNIAVSKLEFHFFEIGNRFEFVYSGESIGNNQWEYTWNSSDSINGIYQVYAVAVNQDNFSYISEFNTIYINNGGNFNPTPDQNINSNINFNNNQNENINSNYNTNLNINNNFNSNQNINQNENINTNTNSNQNENNNFNLNFNSNINYNENINSNIPNTNLNQNNNGNINFNNNINYNQNTNINLPDSDNDGLPDDKEKQHGTDPNNPDTDQDGLTDGFEEDHGFDPNNNDNGTPSRNTDQNINKSINEAIAQGEVDSDQDGVPDSIEQKIGTNPNNPDSNGDGLTDKFEIMNGYSYKNDNSDFIVKKALKLNVNENYQGENASLITAAIILGILIALTIVVIVLFRPKGTKI